MKLSVRLARETMQGINELKEILEEDIQFAGLSLSNGFVVNQAYQEAKDSDWEIIIETKRRGKQTKEILEVKTNLTLSQATIDGINELKKILPQYFEDISYVTTSFVICLIIIAALLKRDKLDD